MVAARMNSKKATRKNILIPWMTCFPTPPHVLPSMSPGECHAKPMTITRRENGRRDLKHTVGQHRLYRLEIPNLSGR
jgi:hypothetical protein